MIYIFTILCFIIFLVVWMLIDSLDGKYWESAIAIVEFGEKIDEKTANKILEQYPIDWYIFNETAIQEEEIEDLKQHYEIILEVK